MCLDISSRAPYGARGLKYRLSLSWWWCYRSRPVWGAWIEIHETC